MTDYRPRFAEARALRQAAIMPRATHKPARPLRLTSSSARPRDDAAGRVAVFRAWTVVAPSGYLGFQCFLGDAWLLATQTLAQQLFGELVELAGDLDAVGTARARHVSRYRM